MRRCESTKAPVQSSLPHGRTEPALVRRANRPEEAPGWLLPDRGEHDPGGRRFVKLAPGVTGRAVFGGPMSCYRYRLERIWTPGLRTVLVVGMNPSTAEAHVDDPTIGKVGRMARHWHNGSFGRLLIGNIFAFRATDQTRLREVNDPVGPENNAHLLAMAKEADITVMAYGQPKITSLRPRGQELSQLLRSNGVKLHVLRLSKAGVPWHPLYLADATIPKPWDVA